MKPGKHQINKGANEDAKIFYVESSTTVHNLLRSYTLNT